MTRWKRSLAILLLTGCAFLGWKLLQREPQPPATQPEDNRNDVIPAGIVVTESSLPLAPPPVEAPGDLLLAGYASDQTPPQQDLVLLGRAISNYLLIEKQASARPLSANEEWSAALRGTRPGHGPWFSGRAPLFDSQQRLIDRWQTPLHFHALGHKQWEIRSAGPDRILWTGDDLLEKTAG